MPEFLFVFVVAMLALTFFSFISRRKQQNANIEMVRSLEPGAEVMTSTGFLGFVVEVSEDVVVLESEPGGARTRWIPPVIMRQVHRVDLEDLNLEDGEDANFDAVPDNAAELIDNYPPDREDDEDKR